MLEELREHRNYFAFVLILFLVLWLADIAFTVQHETVHRQICKKCAPEGETYTNYSFLWTSGDTFCSNVTDISLELNLQNDIFGYHAEVLMLFLFVGLFLLISWDHLKLKKKL